MMTDENDGRKRRLIEEWLPIAEIGDRELARADAR